MRRPGMKIGLADPQRSALGGLTVRLLGDLDIYDAVLTNRKTTSGTADLLVNQLEVAETLDAVVVYEANCSQISDKSRISPIEHPIAIAVQPFTIGKQCTHPQLTARLLDALTTAQSRARFESVGFQWMATSQQP